MNTVGHNGTLGSASHVCQLDRLIYCFRGVPGGGMTKLDPPPQHTHIHLLSLLFLPLLHLLHLPFLLVFSPPLPLPLQLTSPSMQIYDKELEEFFNHFTDLLQTFPLYRGKGSRYPEDPKGEAVGYFKVSPDTESSITY